LHQQVREAVDGGKCSAKQKITHPFHNLVTFNLQSSAAHKTKNLKQNLF